MSTLITMPRNVVFPVFYPWFSTYFWFASVFSSFVIKVDSKADHFAKNFLRGGASTL
jgi:hypothetical protein